MPRSILATRDAQPGHVKLLEMEGGMVMREIVMAAEQGQQLGFDLCKLATEVLKRERTT